MECFISKRSNHPKSFNCKFPYAHEMMLLLKSTREFKESDVNMETRVILIFYLE